MARKIKKEKNQWIKFDKDPEIEFFLKPFTILYLKKLPSDEGFTPDLMWEMFNNSVMDWKGLNDADGKPLKCNEETKRLVAEEFDDILLFVVNQASLIKDSKVSEKEAKN